MTRPAEEPAAEVSEEDDVVACVLRGIESMRRGEGRPMREALEGLGRRQGIELRNSPAVAPPRGGG